MEKRVLFLTSRFPYPPFSGGKQFLIHFARALKHYRVTLLSLCCTREEMDCIPDDGTFDEIHKVYLSRHASYWNVLRAVPSRKPLQLAYYESAAFRDKLEQLLPKHDAVIAHLVRTGQYLKDIGGPAPHVLLMADAISLAYERMVRLRRPLSLWPFLYRIELRRLFPVESAFPAEFDQTWLHSDVDRRFLGLSEQDTRILPMGVDLNEFPFRASSSGNVVAFIGNLSFSLNLDACQYFVREILVPLRRRAEIRFRIIGACPPRIRRKLEAVTGVEITGPVPRIERAMEDVFCGVCPVRGGAGIQNKVLNYLALGIPCVTSEIGLEGLAAVDGADLLVNHSTREAVDLIIQLYSDSNLRERLGRNGRRYIEKNHDWNTLYRHIEDGIATIFDPVCRESNSVKNEENFSTR
jgi:glycosyltransferase involved in cell wall biosynthesis